MTHDASFPEELDGTELVTAASVKSKKLIRQREREEVWLYLLVWRAEVSTTTITATMNWKVPPSNIGESHIANGQRTTREESSTKGSSTVLAVLDDDGE